MTPARSSLRRLGSSAAIYGIATILSRAASFVMLPVYTRMLTPSDYGILQMLDLSVEVLSIFLSAGATAGVMRFYYSAEDPADRKRLLASAFVLLLGLEGVGAVVLASSAPFLSGRLLGPTGSPTMILVASANFLLGSLTTMPLLQYMVEERAVLYASISVARLLLQLSLNIVFLVVLRMGPIGILCSTFVTSVIIGGFSTRLFIKENGLHVTWYDIKRLKRFAIPYQLTAAGSFLLTFGDRFFLKKYFAVDQVGLYGLAYQFGFLLIMVTSGPIIQAWTPIRHQEATLPAEQRDDLYNRSLLLLSTITIAGAIGIALFAAPVLRIVANPAYWDAAKVIPIVVLAYVVRSWSDSFMFAFDVSEQPRYIAVGTWSSVAFIVVLFIILIPRFGGVGAASAVTLAFAFRLGLYWYFSRRVWPMHVSWPRHALLLAMAMLTYGAFVFLGAQTLTGQLSAAALLFTLFAVLAYALLPIAVRRALIAELRNRLRSTVALVSPS